MRTIAIIPARYASTRFPGKPLIDIDGKTMINRVYEQAQKAFEYVCVATDDERIYNHVVSFGGKAVMTSRKHHSGTDRCNEAYSILTTSNKVKPFDVIINVQGDEPLIDPSLLIELESAFKEPETMIATMAKRISDISELTNDNIPKLILDKNHNAIYFSRTPIPFIRDINENEWLSKYHFLKHIGLYAFRPKILQQVCDMAPSPLEISEKLEQLRWIENGLKIKVVETNYETIAVDSPSDVKKVIFHLSKLYINK
jgi:3-deoxy-manno-octulosonate cytidylyltransferase (CMP-KDO synthetase)